MISKTVTAVTALAALASIGIGFGALYALIWTGDPFWGRTLATCATTFLLACLAEWINDMVSS